MDVAVELIQKFQILIGFAAAIAAYLTSYYLWLRKPIKELNGRMSLVEESEKAVLTSRIFSICEDALKRGYTTTEEMKNVEAIYKAYTGFGLNGSAREIHDRFLELPLQGIEVSDIGGERCREYR